jgi:hypothetical protein
MPKFKGYLTKITLNTKRILKSLEERATKVNKEAAREYVRAVIVHVPVYTGMALGSIKLAKGRSGEAAGFSLFQFLNLTIPINPIGYRRDKNPITGGAKGRFTFSHYRGRYNFTISTSVAHYLINEWNEPDNHPSFSKPWHSFQAGEAAYNNYINKNIHAAIPKLKSFIVKTNVPLGE